MVNFKTKECYDIYFQFSFHKPWLLPKVDRHFGKADLPFYGWLFFYFGRITKGVLYEVKESQDKTLIDRKTGKHYHLFLVNDRKYRDIVRTVIKNGHGIEIERRIGENGKVDLGLII